MDTIIKLENLVKIYDNGRSKTHAVNGVSLDIQRGEKVAIIGPSGCGKSTLLNLIGLIIKPSEGHIIILDKNANELNENQKARYRNQLFGYVVQDFALVEESTVYENVEIPLLYAQKRIRKTIRKQKVEAVLQKVGLSIKINEKVKNLSGGQRQRVAIARAIVNDPEIILADEPTGSLDSEISKNMFSLLNNLVKEGKTLVMVTHNTDLAKSCDRQVLMLDGTIIS